MVEIIWLYVKMERISKLEQIEQRTEKWLEARKTIATGTAVANFLGVCGHYGYKEEISNRINPDKAAEKSKSFENVLAVNWGVRYEPITKMVYEKLYNKHVNDIGLVIHPKYKFMGASTDGVTDDGINIEFKSPVTRELGILPLQYWVQTQVQMQTLDLFLTHFFECKFDEFNVDDSDYEVLDGNLSGYYIEVYNTLKKEYKYIYSEVGCVYDWVMEKVDGLLDKTNVINDNLIIVRCMKWKVNCYNMIQIPRSDEWFDFIRDSLQSVIEEVNKEREKPKDIFEI